MIGIIYSVIFVYFVLGAIGFYFINRRKKPDQARKNWIKYGSYFVIIHILFFSIVLNPLFFRYVAVLIIAAGLTEIIALFKSQSFSKVTFFIIALIVYTVLAYGLFLFSEMQTGVVLYTFLILSIFDSFSQITGQLWGKTKLFPNISPNKTVEGLAGGAIVAVASTFLLKGLTGLSTPVAVILSLGVVAFAFFGDLLASLYKRKYNAKDFGRLIPGHGGFLDRFDSLIAAAAWVAFSFKLLAF